MRPIEEVFSPPWATESETSRDAAASVRHCAASLREQVLEEIEEAGGLTCDEVEEKLDGKHQTISARIWELRQMGLLTNSGETRPTRSGRSATVWRAVDA